MFEILLNLACQKIVEPTCIDVPLGDPKFRTLGREDSSMDRKEVHVEVVVGVEIAAAVGGSKANAADNWKRAVSEVVVRERVAAEAGSAGIAVAGSKATVDSETVAGSKSTAQTLAEECSSSEAHLPVVVVNSLLISWRSSSTVARRRLFAQLLS